MSENKARFETSDTKTRKRHEVMFNANISSSSVREAELAVSHVVHVSPSSKAVEAKEQRKVAEVAEERIESAPIQTAEAVKAEEPKVARVMAAAEVADTASSAPVAEETTASPAVSAQAPAGATSVEAPADEPVAIASTDVKVKKKKKGQTEPEYVCAYGQVDYKLEHCESSMKKSFNLSLTTKKALSGWIFVLPFVLGILFIYGPIVINSIAISLSDYQPVTGAMKLTWNNFANYTYMFAEDKYFAISLVDGIKDLILQIPAIVIFALFMAIILNQKMTGRAAFRAIFFLPVILSTGIIDSIDSRSAFMESINNSQGGVDDNTGSESGGILSAMDLQQLLGGIKIGTELVDYVVGLVNDIFNIVSRSGVQMLIFLSGLQSISPSIYESCEVEGASAWETFWKITLPMISPMILVNAVYTVIDAFTAADNRVMYYIFKEVYMKQGSAGYARSAAMSWVYVGVVLMFIVLVALIMKTVVFYQKKD